MTGRAGAAPGRAARFPRVTTRGAYDLATGRMLAPAAGGRRAAAYRVYPRSYFDGLAGEPEIAVMVHGLRNGPRDALRKFEIARGRLRELGYAHPVVGYSYDSNTRGAGAAATRGRALAAGVRIARGNGRALAAFVRRMRPPAASGGTRVRLLGHSLGAQVILSAALELARGGGQAESVHLFGASVPASSPARSSEYGAALRAAVRSSIVNHYAPTDEVLLEAGGVSAAAGGARRGGRRRRPRPDGPLGLDGASSAATVRGYRQVRVRPESHRFASYAAVLERFP